MTASGLFVERTAEDSAVIVTGVCGRLGKRLLRFLPRERPVVGMDQRPFNVKPADVEHYELDFIRYVCMVDDTRAREKLGYSPRYGLDETLRAVDEERWVS